MIIRHLSLGGIVLEGLLKRSITRATVPTMAFGLFYYLAVLALEIEHSLPVLATVLCLGFLLSVFAMFLYYRQRKGDGLVEAGNNKVEGISVQGGDLVVGRKAKGVQTPSSVRVENNTLSDVNVEKGDVVLGVKQESDSVDRR